MKLPNYLSWKNIIKYLITLVKIAQFFRTVGKFLVSKEVTKIQVERLRQEI